MTSNYSTYEIHAYSSQIYYVSSSGAHAPTKPEVTVRGRFELHISWKPPEVPLGKITRYDVKMNGEIIHSGMELHYDVRRLRPDTEYVFTVSAAIERARSCYVHVHVYACTYIVDVYVCVFKTASSSASSTASSTASRRLHVRGVLDVVKLIILCFVPDSRESSDSGRSCQHRNSAVTLCSCLQSSLISSVDILNVNAERLDFAQIYKDVTG